MESSSPTIRFNRDRLPPVPQEPRGLSPAVQLPELLTYATLDEALEKNLIAVTEVSEDGSVPQLRVVNLSETPVLDCRR